MSKFGAKEKLHLNEVFEEMRGASADTRFLHRLHCVQLVAQGCSRSDVARWFNNDPSSIARWMRHFQRFGVEGLRDEQKPGRPAKLGAEQLKALKRELGYPPSKYGHTGHYKWSGKVLASHLEEKYSLTLSTRQCQRLLRQLQASTNVMPKHSAPSLKNYSI